METPHDREYLAAAEGMADMYGRRLEPVDQPDGLVDPWGRMVRVGDEIHWARDGWPVGLVMKSPVIAIRAGRYVVNEDGIHHFVTLGEVVPF